MAVVAAVIFRAAIGPFLVGLFIVDLCAFAITIIPVSLAMSSVYSIGKQFHKGWEISIMEAIESKEQRLWLMKSLNSLPVMKSEIGGFYYMESRAKLTLLTKISRGIAFLLVTFR